MDLIDRQAAIDALRRLYIENPQIDNDFVYDMALDQADDAIKQLPPIQPEIIHCGDGCKFWDKFAGEQKGTCYILRQCTSDSFYCGNAKRREVTT